MALFEFELTPVQDIEPWDSPGGPNLSWFALSYGRFRMPVGDQVLFEYTDEILAHWGDCAERTADYQIAAFVRDTLGSVAAGTARLPERIERFAADSHRLHELRTETLALGRSPESEELSYTAWRWMGERHPWTGYLLACPNLYFLRIGDEVRIDWDNRDRMIEGCHAWTAERGVFAMPVESFVDECRDFAGRLLGAMDARIKSIEAGRETPQTPVDLQSLWQQHETWRVEFASYFKEYQPDIPWGETEAALQLIAEKRGLSF